MGEPVPPVPVDYWWQEGDSSIKWLLPDAQHTGSLWLREKEDAIEIQSLISKNTTLKCSRIL